MKPYYITVSRFIPCHGYGFYEQFDLPRMYGHASDAVRNARVFSRGNADLTYFVKSTNAGSLILAECKKGVTVFVDDTIRNAW